MENRIIKIIESNENISIKIDENMSSNFLYLIDAKNDLNFNINLTLTNNSSIYLNIITFSYNDSKVNINVNTISKDDNIHIVINNHNFGFDNSLINVAIKSTIINNAKNNQVYQNILGFLMSESTTIKGQPILEIQTEQVIAKHSLKIGSLDKDEVFYLQTKGFSVNLAKKILIDSLIKKILCEFPEVTHLINDIIKKRF